MSRSTGRRMRTKIGMQWVIYMDLASKNKTGPRIFLTVNLDPKAPYQENLDPKAQYQDS